MVSVWFFFLFLFFFFFFPLSRDNEFVRDTGILEFSCSLCLYGECVARACVQCERTSVHRAELVGVVGECVVSCARGQLSLSRCTCSGCSSFSVLVEERSSIAWKTKTLCSRRLLGRRRLCALVDCLEDEDFVLSSIAWKTRIVCCRRLLGTWIEDGPRDRDSVLSSIAWNVEDDLEMQRAVVDWLGDARTVARSCCVAVGWNRG